MRPHLDPAPPVAADLRIEETGDLTVSFGPQPSWGAVVFFAVWLLLWTAGGLAAMSSLRTASAGGAAFLLVWLCGWALGECVAIGVVAWHLRGCELLTVTPTDLEVRQELARFSRTTRYDAVLVRDVTAARVPHGGDERPRKGFCLRVSYGDDIVHIGHGMSQRDAEYVASVVLSRIGPRRSWWSDDDKLRPDGADLSTADAAAIAADGRGTTHVYRRKESEHRVLVRLLLAAGHLVAFAVVVGGPVAWVVWAWREGPGRLLVAVVVSLLFWGTGFRNHYYRSCREVRLSDDGRCELHAERRVVRLGAGDITSVRDGTGDEDAGYHYLIHYEGGKMKLYGDWPDFDDFVARLEAINPYVDLTSCRPRRALRRDEAVQLHQTVEPRSRGDELREMLEIARREARHGESSWR